MSLGAVTVLASQLVGVTGVAKNLGGTDFQKKFDEAVAAVSSSGMSLERKDSVQLSSSALAYVEQHTPENTPADARPVGPSINLIG